MRGIYAFVTLAVVASGLPAHEKGNQKRGLTDVHQSTSSSDILEYIQNIFEKTCHNLCLKRFPKDGREQDLCMSICRS